MTIRYGVLLGFVVFALLFTPTTTTFHTKTTLITMQSEAAGSPTASPLAGTRAGEGGSMVVDTHFITSDALSVDGSLDDWGAIPPALNDSGDPISASPVDITSVYIAHSFSRLYIGVAWKLNLSVSSDAVPYISILLAIVSPGDVGNSLFGTPLNRGNQTLGTDRSAFLYEWEVVSFSGDTYLDNNSILTPLDMPSASTSEAAEICINTDVLGVENFFNSTVLLSIRSGLYLAGEMEDTDAVPSDFRHLCIQYPVYTNVFFSVIESQYNTVIPDGSFEDWAGISPSASIDGESGDGDVPQLREIRITHNTAYLNVALNLSTAGRSADGGPFWGFFVAFSHQPVVDSELHALPFRAGEGGNTSRVGYDIMVMWDGLDPKRVSVYNFNSIMSSWELDLAKSYSAADIMGMSDDFIELRLPLSSDGIDAALGSSLGILIGTFAVEGNDIHSFVLADTYPANPLYHHVLYNLSTIPVESHGVKVTPHVRTITIDGNLSDWSGIGPAWIDRPDFANWNKDSDGDGNVDIFGQGVDPRVMDIKDVYVCHDTNFLYLGVEFFGDLEPYGESRKVALEVDIETSSDAPIFNYTPSADVIHEYTYTLNGILREDQSMITTSGYGFNISTVDYWLSQTFDYINPTNHDAFYYLNGTSTYWYYSASMDLTTTVSGNVLEMKVPLFDHGFYAHPDQTLRFSVISCIWNVPFMYPLDMAPYNDTYGVPLFFEYPLTIDNVEWASSTCNDYIEKLDFAFSNLLNISKEEFADDYGEYTTLKAKYFSGTDDVYTLSLSLENLYNRVEARYAIYTASTEVKMFSYIYNNDEMSPIYDLLFSSREYFDAGEYAKARDAARSALESTGNLLPAIKAVIYDSEGTNNMEARDWDGVLGNLSRYTWLNISVDYRTLNRENITYNVLAATSADVVVIDNAKNRASGELLTEEEIDALATFVSEGRGLVGTGYTLGSTTYPEHERLAELFGIDPSTKPLTEVRGTRKYIFDDPSNDLFVGMAMSGFVSGTPFTIAPVAIMHDGHTRFVAHSERNVSFIIERHSDEWHSLYFTSPILRLQKSHIMWQPNEDNYRIFFNAIADTSGLYEVPEAIALLTRLQRENSDIVGESAVSSEVDMARELYRQGDLAGAKRKTYTTLRTYLDSICTTRISDISGDVSSLSALDIESYGPLVDKLNTLKVMYNTSSTTSDLYALYIEIKNLSSELDAIILAESALMLSNLSAMYGMVNNISAMGYDVEPIMKSIEQGIEMAESHDLPSARSQLLAAESGLYSMYLKERERVKSHVNVADSNLFSDTRTAREELSMGDAAAAQGLYDMAFGHLKRADNSIRDGYPVSTALSVLALVIALVIVVALIAVQKRTDIKYMADIMDEIIKSRKHRDAVFVASPQSSASEQILANALSYASEGHRPLFIYDYPSSLEDELKPQPRIVISRSMKGRDVFHPARCDMSDLLVTLSRISTVEECDMIVCTLRKDFRNIKAPNIQKAGFIRHLINMARKRNTPLFLYLAEGVLPDRDIARITNLSSNTYYIDHISARGMMDFFRTRRIYDYFTYRNHGTWDRIARSRRSDKGVDRTWYILGNRDMLKR